MIETTGATGTASVWARPSRPDAPWIGWNDSARSATGGQIRIAVPRSRAGEVPQIPACRFRGPSILRTRAIRPQARDSIAPEVMTISAVDPEPSGGPSLTTIACALKETASIVDRGGSPRRDRRAGFESAAGRGCAREGERSQPIRGAA